MVRFRPAPADRKIAMGHSERTYSSRRHRSGHTTTTPCSSWVKVRNPVRYCRRSTHVGRSKVFRANVSARSASSRPNLTHRQCRRRWRALRHPDSPGAMPRRPGHHSLTFGVPASPHAVGSRSQKPPARSPKAFCRKLRRWVESLPAGAARGGNVWRLAACHETCSRDTGSRGDTGW